MLVPRSGVLAGPKCILVLLGLAKFLSMLWHHFKLTQGGKSVRLFQSDK